MSRLPLPEDEHADKVAEIERRRGLPVHDAQGGETVEGAAARAFGLRREPFRRVGYIQHNGRGYAVYAAHSGHFYVRPDDDQ